MAGHIRGQRCEDVSGGGGLNTSLQGVSELKVARMSQAKVAGPPWGTALPRSELRGYLKRKLPEHLTPGRVGTQSCEDVSSESGRRTTMGQGISEVRDARTSQANVARTPHLRASRNLELQGCLRRKWPDHHGAGHLRGQSCEDISSESGLTNSAQGVSESRVPRMCLRRRLPDHLK